MKNYLTSYKHLNIKELQAQSRRLSKNEAKNTFINYIRTKAMLKLRLRGIDMNDDFVFIPQKLIEMRFFPYPQHNRKTYLYELQREGELEIRNIAPATPKDHARYEYKALKPGIIDLSLLEKKVEKLGYVSEEMRNHLKMVTLADGSESTKYFDLFLKYKHEYIEHFFTVDDFSGRVHTPVTNLHRHIRPNILIDGKKTVSFDVATMQPLILGRLLKGAIGKNDFSDWLESGEDIYKMIQHRTQLASRDEAQKLFFEIMFAPSSNGIKEMFGQDDWVQYIQHVKRRKMKQNPHGERRHTNLSWLLQNQEVRMMRKVWKKLYNSDIVFLSIHDEIIVKDKQKHIAESIFTSVLDNEFKVYKLNTKSNP